MKFLISILLIALISFAACLYLPWWSISIVAFIVAAIIPQKAVVSFFAGFIALFLLWTILSALISSGNEHVLAKKIAMLVLKSDNSTLLILITGLTGGLVAGLGALTGSFVRRPARV